MKLIIRIIKVLYLLLVFSYINARESYAYIYVLPFDNLKNDPAVEWISTGLSDMVRQEIKDIYGVRVKTQEDLETIMNDRSLMLQQPRGSRNLLVLGKFSRQLDKVNVNVQVIDVATWEELGKSQIAESYNQVPLLNKTVGNAVMQILKPFLPKQLDEKIATYPKYSDSKMLHPDRPAYTVKALGAGGGSIAYIDDGGAFRVGPKSAGAVPGPACYGNGGVLPTVTDAQVVLGRLDQEQFLGGDIIIDPSLAKEAIRKHIAEPLGLSVSDAALGILKIINNNMALAINSNSVAKGIDPREFTLMGFGGAGPLHSVALAEMISARNVISPAQPGITAALGLLVTDLKYEHTRSVLITLNDASTDQLNKINRIVDELKNEADLQLNQDKVSKDNRKYEYIMECRYLGQGFELRTKMPDEPLTKQNVGVVIDNFYEVHKQQYGHAFRDQITEAITIRIIASVDVDKLTFTKLKTGGVENPSYAQLYARDTVFDDGKRVSTPRYSRDKLKSEDYLTGPSVITQHNSTTIVPPGYRATMLDAGDIIIEKTE